jgi:hypothetical protein
MCGALRRGLNVERLFYKKYLKILESLSILILVSCQAIVNTPNSTPPPSPYTLLINSSSGVSGSSFTLSSPNASGYSSVTLDLGSAFQVSNFSSSKNIFGRSGAATISGDPTVLVSNVNRSIAGIQVYQYSEWTTYAGTALPSTGGYSYRNGASILNDDDGQYNTDAGCAANCTSVISITAAQHAGYSDCGVAQATISGRIADCASTNGSAATWSGSSNGNSGEGIWKLVARSGANHEVWQDQRTGLLWSSIASTNADWCEASGNNDGADPAGYCNVNTTSYCIETLYPGGGTPTVGFAGDTFPGGPYDSAKGLMGLGSTPPVSWRLPTSHDYLQAEVDGIRHVMPDMGAFGGGNSEWIATVNSIDRTRGYKFGSNDGVLFSGDRFGLNNVRCVGR